MDDMPLDEAMQLADQVSPLPTLAGRALKRLRMHIHMLREIDVDRRQLLHALDVALNGEDAAAAKPGLGDLLAQVQKAARARGAPLLVERRHPVFDEVATRIRNTLLADGRNEQVALFDHLLVERQRDALEAAQQQGEAVAEVVTHGSLQYGKLSRDDIPDGTKLYTAPPAQPAERCKPCGGMGNIMDMRCIECDGTGRVGQPAERVPEGGDAARFRFVVEHNWIGAKTRCERRIQDSDLASARRAVDEAMLAPSPAPSPARGDGGEG